MIIFRVDDVSAGWYPRVTKNITMTFILKGVPLTLALVPTGGRGTIADDEEMVTFLRTVSSNKRLIEIAQHGWNHSNRPPNGEFRGRPFIDQYNDIKNGKSILDNAFYNYNGNVSTFTVTYNVYDENTVKAAAHLGFTVFSSKLLMDWWDSFVTPPYQHNRFDENGLLYLDWNVLFLDENSREPYPVTVTTTNCKTMLKLFGVCIILLHIQDFRKGSEDVVDERKYTVLLELINELRKIPNVLFTTMREYYAIRKALVE
ncbi:MAG: DUF2334 domain-containing protein [Nitrososphaerota archaeon]